jgi:hypothetical protein
LINGFLKYKLDNNSKTSKMGKQSKNKNKVNAKANKNEAALNALFNSTEYHPCVHLLCYLCMSANWLKWSAEGILDSEDSENMRCHGEAILEYKDLEEKLERALFEWLVSNNMELGDIKSQCDSLQEECKNILAKIGERSNKTLMNYLKSSQMQKAYDMLKIEVRLTCR